MTKNSILKSVAFIFFITVSGLSNAQLVINEICSSNSSINPDEDGDYSDWIELYNSGSTPVNLFNYSVSDDALNLRKWILPSYNLAPNDHVLIFASNKNRKSAVNHWETAIKDDDIWKYLVPTAEPSATWRSIGFDDSAWPSGKGGFGYGDGDDSTIITGPANSVYIRKTFTVTDKTKLAEALLHIDYDDGYVAYLNGYPIARSNMPTGYPPYNTDATAGREATMYNLGLPEMKLINRDTLLLALVNGTNVLCIQVHNNLISSSDITARAFLSFGISDASIIYNSTPAWFNVTNSLPMHTNFKLSSGETLYLANDLSVAIDFKVVEATKTDHSYGRKPDGNAGWVIFTAPTPEATNNSAASIPAYCTSALSFSVNAGFYPSARTVAITGSTGIRYTLDGSEPTAASALYTTPITINATKVLRAGCFPSGTIPLQSFTNTYFINEPTTLPVFSLSTDPGLLFDPMTGIYSLGPNADSSTAPFFGANFWEDWKRPIHVEFFEKDKSLIIDQDASVRIYGNYSRANAQKSLLLKAEKKYGDDSFSHKFFPDKSHTSMSDIVLRNSGGDFNIMHFRDGFIQKSVSEKTEIDIQDYRPSVVFINGAYWGILNIREKINTEYIENNHGINKDKVDLAETWGNALDGTNNIYILQWWAKNRDLTNAADYKLLEDSIDFDNMIDYFSTEIFISNWDWPGNNIKFWRPQEGNRKYRYILWDTDISLGLWNLQTVNFNQLGRIKNAATMSIGPHADIFSELLKNTTYRNRFVNRYADMMNSTFRTSTLNKLIDDLADSISTEMPKHATRWNAWAVWSDEIQKAKDFYSNRLSYARNEIKNEFALTKQVNITLAAFPASAGYIKINSIFPPSLPWSGVYFDGVPVVITAYPNPGYTFQHWQSSTLIPSANINQSITINVTTASETFTAYFTGSAKPFKIAITELNYNSSITADAGDWLELTNYGTNPADLSGWSIKDNFHSYILPPNTIILAGDRLVLSDDVTKFSSQFPGVNKFIGPMSFSMGNGGDYIGLYNLKGDEYTSVTYNDKAPWPTQADGLGYTLESTSNTANPNVSTSWFAGCLGGSPSIAYNASCITGVEEIQSANETVSIFPNPAKNAFNIEIKNNTMFTEWKLFNALGSEILQKQIEGTLYSEKIEINNLTSGLYTVVFSGENNTIVKRIIIQ